MRYSQYFNKKRASYGHLWQGRFFSCPLDKEHLYEAIRYVELNPIRAGLVGGAEDYKWSSACDRLTRNKNTALHSIKKYLEIDDWRAYLMEKENEELIQNIRKNTKTGRPLGKTSFVKKIESLTGKSFKFKPNGRPKKEV